MHRTRTHIITAALVVGLAGALVAQPVNVAPLGVAIQSTTDFGGVPSRAIDGNTNGLYGGGSVTHTMGGDPAPSWEVALPRNYTIDTISIWNRTDACCVARLTNFRVTILDGVDEVFTVDLFTDLSAPNPSVDIDVGGVEGTGVRVARLGVPEDFPDTFFLSLAEVQVFTDASTLPPAIQTQPMDATVAEGQCHRFSVGLFNAENAESVRYRWKKNDEDIVGATGATLLLSDVTPDDAGMYSVCVDVDDTRLVSDFVNLIVTPPNLALGGTASASTTGFNGPPNLAIDGNTNGVFNGGSVTHTAAGDLNPWWEVELLSTSTIDEVVIWNRTDCCSARLTNFRLSVLNEAREEVFGEDLFTDLSFPNPNVSVAIGGVDGLFVRIERLGVEADFPGQFFVSLAEVQIFGAGELPQPPKNLGRRCGTLVTQSSQLGGFAPGLALNGNLGDFTHTAGADDAASWRVELVDDFEIGRVVLHNRTSCCGSRLRDITVTVLDAAGDVVYESLLLNPENELGAFPNGPASLTAEIQFDGGPVVGRTVVVSRTPDPDLSGSGGMGNADEANVLSLGEVEICPPISCEGSGNAACDGVAVTDVQGPDESGLFTISVEASGSDAEGDALSYSFVVTDGEGTVVASVGPQDSGLASFSLPEGDYTVSALVEDHPICPISAASECSVDVSVACDSNAVCEGLVVSDVQGPDEFDLFAVTVDAASSDAEGDTLSYVFEVSDSEGAIVASVGPQESNVATFELAEGDYTVSVQVSDTANCPAGEAGGCSVDLTLPVNTGIGPFLRADCNGDGTVGGVTDAVFHLGFNFLGGPTPPCLAACDSNGDGGSGGVTDPVYTLNFLFLGGVAPPAPFPTCGTSDLESDLALGCEQATACI